VAGAAVTPATQRFEALATSLFRNPYSAASFRTGWKSCWHPPNCTVALENCLWRNKKKTLKYNLEKGWVGSESVKERKHPKVIEHHIYYKAAIFAEVGCGLVPAFLIPIFTLGFYAQLHSLPGSMSQKAFSIPE